MKKTILLFANLLIITSLAYSQSWSNSSMLYGTSDLSVIATESDSYKNTYLFGYFEGSILPSEPQQIDSRGGRDYFLAKYNTTSELVWIKGIGGNANEFSNGGLSISQDDHVFITGAFQSYLYYTETDSIESTGMDDVFLAKYDLDGNIVWCKNIGKGQKRQRPTCLSIDLDENLLIGGYFADSIQFSDILTIKANNSFKDYFIAKIEPTNGIAQWCNPIKSIDSNYSGFIYSITATENNYYISGAFADSIQIENDTIVSETEHYYDTHIMKSNKEGIIEWIRQIKGTNHEYSYTSSVDTEENIYLTGYFNSSQISIDSIEGQSVLVDQIGGGFDFFIVKYDSEGTLQWFRQNGGKGKDRLLQSEIFENDLHVSGYFADTMSWGGILLTTNGVLDQDMFTATLDLDGNYRSANKFGGTNDSEEAGIAVFHATDALYSVIRSNSELLVLGGDIYTSSTGFDYIVIGVISCLPISIDNTIYTDVSGCYGDSTGGIQIAASGGFEGPWTYSIDNNETSQASPYFPDLPAGSYQVVVFDKEHCTEVGQVVTLSQPDSLLIEFISSGDITVAEDGSIVVAAQGGTSPYTFTLLPNNDLQGFGTFTFAPGDSGQYVVELNDGNLCGPVSTDTILIQDLSHVGMNELGALMLRVFPNPATDLVTVEMQMEAAEVSMEILSLAGQVVMSKQAYTTGGVLRETIDVSDLVGGMYMLRVNGKTLKSAIVIN